MINKKAVIHTFFKAHTTTVYPHLVEARGRHIASQSDALVDAGAYTPHASALKMTHRVIFLTCLTLSGFDSPLSNKKAVIHTFFKAHTTTASPHLVEARGVEPLSENNLE